MKRSMRFWPSKMGFPMRRPAALKPPGGKRCCVTALILLVSALSLPLSALAQAGGADITGYRSIFRPCYDRNGNLEIAIRRYEIDGTPHVMLVNPRTLETSVALTSSLKRFPASGSAAQIEATPFIRALDRYTAPPYRLQNHGAIRANHPTKGMFLTVDMCPSRKPFEKEFFTAVAALSRQSGRPTPLTISMTGNWLENHRDDLAWIVEQVRKGRLAVTWMNHSYSHPYEPMVPLDRNFLLSPGVDFEREVLATEQLMLENGLVPAPFFRFPGLVADGKLLEKLRGLSLIPVGSDAWLAKGESPTSGSFILVHGNGNEPVGIRKVMPLLEREDLRLLPLRKAFAGAQ